MKKSDCLEFLSLHLAKTSNWRRLQAQRFPDDARNARAAQLLFDLAAQPTDISDKLWNEIGPHFDPCDRHFSDAVSTASRDLGFRSSARTFEGFVESVLAALLVSA